MTDIDIQKVTLNNIDQLEKIGRQTFFETFASGNTKENMNSYLDEGFSVAKLTTELNDNNAAFYFASHLQSEIFPLTIYALAVLANSNILFLSGL